MIAEAKRIAGYVLAAICGLLVAAAICALFALAFRYLA